jgi:DNA-binding NarL/FixJ family response regulator
VIGESEDCADIVRLLRAMPAQVVILNLSQTQSGADIIRAIQRACSGACVIVLTLSPSVEYVLELLDAGASGCLTKECASTELLAAVDKVLEGAVYLSPGLLDRVVTRYVRPARQDSRQAQLAPRERQVLRMIASGFSTKEIACEMQVSSKTIETYRRRIMEKLNRHSVAELTKYAVMEGLTTLEASA